MIRLLWESDGPVDFDGQFYTLHHARLDTEPYEGRFPQIWIGASGPRMLDIAGRYADGWWPAGRLDAGALRREAFGRTDIRRARRSRSDGDHAGFIQICLIGANDDALAEILQAPLVKAFLLQVSAETLRGFGFDHPMGAELARLPGHRPRGADPRADPRVPGQGAARDAPGRRAAWNTEEVATIIKTYVDAGLRVPKILDYGAMAGLKYAESSAANVRAAEDELMQLCGDLS